MPNRSVVCPDCEEPLPHGRLSCPRCGALLASVAGLYRAPVRATQPRSSMAASLSWAGAPLLARDAHTGSHGDLDDASEPLPTHEPGPVTEPPASPAPQPQVLPSEAIPPMTSPALPADEVVPAGAPADVDDASEPAPPDVDVPADATTAGVVGTSAAGAEPWPLLRAASVRRSPTADTSQPAPPVARKARDAATGTEAAGAYVPPTEPVPLLSSSEVRHRSAGRGPTPRTFVLHPSATTAVTAAIASASRPADGFLADGPFRVPGDTAGRVVAAASAAAALAFLLPWTDEPVLGGGGYTAGWGFAASSYVVPWLLAVGLLLVTLLPERVPGWLRAGTLPLAIGALLLGLAWPHVLGPAGSHVGSLLAAAAALALMAAGLAAGAPARHGGVTPPV